MTAFKPSICRCPPVPEMLIQVGKKRNVKQEEGVPKSSEVSCDWGLDAGDNVDHRSSGLSCAIVWTGHANHVGIKVTTGSAPC